MTVQHPLRSNSPYPSENEHRRRWRSLAAEIAARADDISDDPARIMPPDRVGELEVIGSGIEAVGFTSADEKRIRDADKVLYCVADPATKVWLNRLRPDALDLYVLYDDAKARYVTYMQMTEAMLHYVRQGQTVAAVFYGHPGIFVLSTHRAIKIARREGHRATMRPAVSALDTLCADLGVDPSQPGMVMYEASDMLIRRRRPDTGLHLVLWQVGLIGELGYRRQGYINANFGVLLDYLEDLYGADQTVVNYVGSRYPGVEPQIDRQTIASLRDPQAQARVTGISTFYLPPRTVAESDAGMLERLGLIRPGQPLRTPDQPLRVIDRYAARERKAFEDFARFDVPRTYQWQRESEAADFILALRDDRAFRDLYRSNPAAAVAAYPGPLDAVSRRLMARGDPGAIQLAAKESRRSCCPSNRAFFTYLLARKSETADLGRLSDLPPENRLKAAETWVGKRGMSVDWPNLSEDWALYLRQELTPWGGFYLCRMQERSIVIHARPGGAGDRIVLDGQRLRGARLLNGVIFWEQADGNATSGRLQTDLLSDGTRRLVGTVWADGEQPSVGAPLRLYETRLKPTPPLSVFAGAYGSADLLPSFEVGGAEMRLWRDGSPVPDAVAVSNRHLVAGVLRVPLSQLQIDDLRHVHGRFALRMVSGDDASVRPLDFTAAGLSLAGHSLDAEIRDGALIWSAGPAGARSGDLRFLVDPITLCPLAYGSARTAGGRTVHLRGYRPPTDVERSRLAAASRMGVPTWAWPHLLRVQLDAAAKGGLFLWHGWDRAAVNQRRIGRLLDALREHVPL